MKKIFLIFILQISISNNYAQTKVSTNVDSVNLVQAKHHEKITIAKNLVILASDAPTDVAKYATQSFYDRNPATSWMLLVLLVISIWRFAKWIFNRKK